ncbi:MaoC family dehydratase N-terminal domain-containing protein [Frankia sp. AgB32]|uniref:FAS1-like dehydratase domain-containing protein n=1 Tax=Frankia sp. AgB32 TaxID=631119 RepID=UPI00200EE995|nr:MaoC family dehydratase N-terminal domain-containing protein [Frankia sp. AgB32]MCK9893491.1 MaoC family dehydratase N-terminal domain-containing protein [Frankia sp. AgB32]
MADFSFPVEAGQIMLFARAVGDPNPVYADPVAAAASEAGGILAPPTFVQVAAHYDPDWQLRPEEGKPWFGSGRTASGVTQTEPHGGGPGGGLHAEQHFEYHRHPRPGDVLAVARRPGDTWEKSGRRGGRLVFAEVISEYRDAAGELVITARNVVVRPERTVDAGAAG